MPQHCEQQKSTEFSKKTAFCVIVHCTIVHLILLHFFCSDDNSSGWQALGGGRVSCYQVGSALGGGRFSCYQVGQHWVEGGSAVIRQGQHWVEGGSAVIRQVNTGWREGQLLSGRPALGGGRVSCYQVGQHWVWKVGQHLKSRSSLVTKPFYR